MFAAILGGGRKATRSICFEKNEKCGKKTVHYRSRPLQSQPMPVRWKTFPTTSAATASFFTVPSMAPPISGRHLLFLKENGTKTKVERGERVFPLSDHSSDVIGALTRRMRALGVQVHLNIEAKEILTEEGRVDASSFSDENKGNGRCSDSSHRRSFLPEYGIDR